MSEILHFQVDSSSGVPAYRQLMDQVRYSVASGALRAGEKLPSIRTLAKRLHLNPTTITKAYNELQHAGVLRLEQGRGVFVTELAGTTSEETVRRELRRLAASLAAAAVRMGVPVGETLDLVREEMGRLAESEGREAETDARRP